MMSGLNHKPNEAGWFYHAPTKKETDYQPVGAPPPSQIPGLGQMEEFEQEKPKELVFRETDTKYIRLAKMGGRKDLLTINSNSANTSEPVSYPRCDWFYLEDNALEDKPKEDKKWEFLLPEYMVHHAYQPHGDTAAEASNGVPMRRPPYATENQSCFYQDGHSLSDKTVSLPEIKRPGYGTRNAKAANSKQPNLDKDNPLSSQALKNHPRPNYQLQHVKDSETTMSKLLSNSYEREWHEQNRTKQAEQHGEAPTMVKEEKTVQGEHNTNDGHSPPTGATRSGRRNSGHKAISKNTQSSKKKEDELKKEPFKLSKFKNVPARVDTHQIPEVLAAVGH